MVLKYGGVLTHAGRKQVRTLRIMHIDLYSFGLLNNSQIFLVMRQYNTF